MKLFAKIFKMIKKEKVEDDLQRALNLKILTEQEVLKIQWERAEERYRRFLLENKKK